MSRAWLCTLKSATASAWAAAAAANFITDHTTIGWMLMILCLLQTAAVYEGATNASKQV